MPKKPATSRRGLHLLGGPPAEPPAAPSVATLETFANRSAGRAYWIRFECAEFTSLCPITGQPDFATLTIDYVPKKLCLETKALKFYLASFRNTKSFNEEVVNRILDDLVKACQPAEMVVHGRFSPRGGIRVVVDAFYPAGKAQRPPLAS
jgi:7-cyano-7-deazaguanine reductase